jgi:hypothetical protein
MLEGYHELVELIISFLSPQSIVLFACTSTRNHELCKGRLYRDKMNHFGRIISHYWKIFGPCKNYRKMMERETSAGERTRDIVRNQPDLFTKGLFYLIALENSCGPINIGQRTIEIFKQVPMALCDFVFLSPMYISRGLFDIIAGFSLTGRKLRWMKIELEFNDESCPIFLKHFLGTEHEKNHLVIFERPLWLTLLSIAFCKLKLTFNSDFESTRKIGIYNGFIDVQHLGNIFRYLASIQLGMGSPRKDIVQFFTLESIQRTYTTDVCNGRM